MLSWQYLGVWVESKIYYASENCKHQSGLTSRTLALKRWIISPTTAAQQPGANKNLNVDCNRSCHRNWISAIGPYWVKGSPKSKNTGRINLKLDLPQDTLAHLKGAIFQKITIYDKCITWKWFCNFQKLLFDAICSPSFQWQNHATDSFIRVLYLCLTGELEIKHQRLY